jgi:hypothetical protein
MPEPVIPSVLAEFAKAALSDVIKESIKDWLTDTVRVKRAVKKAALEFSTKLPGTEDALTIWVATDAFRSAMEDLTAGRSLSAGLASVDEFLSVTGIGFGGVSRDVARGMITAFYRIVREDLVGGRQGLVLIDNRIGEVQRQFEQFRSDIAAQVGVERISAEFLTDVAQTQGWGGGIGFGATLHVNLQLPPAVRNIAKRAETVLAVRARLQTAAWYAMYGGSGAGKTQLAILICHTFAGPKVWIRLGGPVSAAGLVLESALAKLAPRQANQSTQDWFGAACLSLGSDGVIVLDDLPHTIGSGAFDEHLAALFAACAATGVRLITTSSGPLPSGTRAFMGDRVFEEPAPAFCEDDIRQLFRAHGASETFLSSTWFGFVHRMAKQHPVLLVEAARYLRARGWATDDRSFVSFRQSCVRPPESGFSFRQQATDGCSADLQPAGDFRFADSLPV